MFFFNNVGIYWKHIYILNIFHREFFVGFFCCLISILWVTDTFWIIGWWYYIPGIYIRVLNNSLMTHFKYTLYYVLIPPLFYLLLLQPIPTSLPRFTYSQLNVLSPHYYIVEISVTQDQKPSTYFYWENQP